MRDIRLELIFEIEKALNNLRKAEKGIEGFEKTTDRAGDTSGRVFAGLKSGIAAFVGALAVGKVVDFANESVELSDKAKDLRRSFGNLARKEGVDVQQLMLDLKKSTGGSVDEIKLMQQATRGKFLGVDLKNLPTLFEFARQRARDTGESVDHLVESIVVGIGRKSPLILDNLGLTMDQLRGAAKQVAIENGTWKGSMDQATFSANIQAAAVEVAKKSLEENGEVLRTATSDYKKFQAELTNTKIRVGDLLSGVQAFGVSAFAAINDGFNTFLDNLGVGGAARLRELSAEFKRVEDGVKAQDKTLKSLLNRYNELKPLAGDNAEAQAELKKVVGEIVKILPDAAAEVDDYGNALDINVASVDNFRKAQQALAKQSRREILANLNSSLKSNAENVAEARTQIKALNTEISELDKRNDGETFSGEQKVRGNVVLDTRVTVGEQISQNRSKIAEFRQQIIKSNEDFEAMVFVAADLVDLTREVNITKLSTELNISEETTKKIVGRFKEIKAAEDERAKTSQALAKAKAEEELQQKQQLETQKAAAKAAKTAEKAQAEAARKKLDLETSLQEIRFQNIILNTKTDIEQQLLRLDKKQVNEERSLAKLLDIENAALLERSQLRIAITEKDAEALRLLDENAVIKRTTAVNKISETSAKDLQKILSKNVKLSVEEGTQRELAALKERFSSEKIVFKKQVAELNAIRQRASEVGDDMLAAQSEQALANLHKSLLKLEENYQGERNEIIAKGADETETRLTALGQFLKDNLQSGLESLVTDTVFKNEDLERQKESFQELVGELVELSEIENLTEQQQSRRSEVIEELNSGYGEYLKNIDLDKAKTGELQGLLKKAGEITSISNRAKKAWSAFFSSFKQEVVSFLASQAVKALLGFLFNLASGGASGLVGSLFSSGTREFQTGGLIKGSSAGELVTVGEGNTDEVIIPVKRLQSFVQGEHRLGDGTAIDSFPAGRALLSNTSSQEKFPSGALKNNTPSPSRPFAKLANGRVFSGLTAPSFPASLGNGSTVRTEIRKSRIVERITPVEGEIRIKTIAPDAAEVQDYFVNVNRNVLRPDNKFADEFLETKNGEFD